MISEEEEMTETEVGASVEDWTWEKDSGEMIERTLMMKEFKGPRQLMVEIGRESGTKTNMMNLKPMWNCKL